VLDLRVHLLLVIVIPGHGGIDLCQREVRMVLLNRIGIPPVRLAPVSRPCPPPRHSTVARFQAALAAQRVTDALLVR
jgi:hypothetical protein